MDMRCSLFNNTGKFWGKLMETCKINYSKFKRFKHSTSVLNTITCCKHRKEEYPGDSS